MTLRDSAYSQFKFQPYGNGIVVKSGWNLASGATSVDLEKPISDFGSHFQITLLDLYFNDYIIQ